MADITRINCRVGIEAVYNSVACLMEDDFRVDYSVGFGWIRSVRANWTRFECSCWLVLVRIRNRTEYKSANTVHNDV